MLHYRVEWPNDCRDEDFKSRKFSTTEEALEAVRAKWGGCFELHLHADQDVGHYFVAPLHFTTPGRSSPRVMPVRHEVRYMAGDCRTGTGRSRIKWHILPTPNRASSSCDKALCGKSPAIQWSDAREGQPATCPACLKRFNAL